MTTGGGNNLGSTPTEFFATFRPVAVVVTHFKVAYPPGVCRTRATVESLTRGRAVESLQPWHRSAGGAHRAQSPRIKQGINTSGFVGSTSEGLNPAECCSVFLRFVRPDLGFPGTYR